MSDDKENVEKLLKILGLPAPPEDANQKAVDVILAAIFLSEGMDMTFEVFADKGQAIDAILGALKRVGKQHGIQFEAKNSMHPLH